MCSWSKSCWFRFNTIPIMLVRRWSKRIRFICNLIPRNRSNTTSASNIFWLIYNIVPVNGKICQIRQVCNYVSVCSRSKCCRFTCNITPSDSTRYGTSSTITITWIITTITRSITREFFRFTYNIFPRNLKVS